MRSPPVRWMAFLTISVAAVVTTIALADSGGTKAPAAGAVIGQPAPAFALKDSSGKEVTLADYAGKIVVLEWVNPDCPFVLRHYKEGTFAELAARYADQGVAYVAINSSAKSSADVNKAFATANGVKYPILADADGTVGKAYGAKTTPHMFVIDRKGVLAYKGAIDNDPEGTRSGDKVNYVDAAIQDLLANRAVKTPETKSYGCGVKYAK